MAGTRFTVGSGHQLVQDAAFSRRMPCRALVTQSGELTLQRTHGFQPRPHARELLVDQAINIATIGFGMRNEIEQSFHRSKRHIQRTAMTDKSQSLQVSRTIAAVAIAGAGWRRQ